jgi:hypothetical protein
LLVEAVPDDVPEVLPVYDPPNQSSAKRPQEGSDRQAIEGVERQAKELARAARAVEAKLKGLQKAAESFRLPRYPHRTASAAARS